MANFPLTESTASLLTLTSASESMVTISCVIRYELQSSHSIPQSHYNNPPVLLYVCLCLQAFFCGRSDYFKALLEDHFSEGEQLQSQPSTPVITLHNISHEIFIHVMYYIYTDYTEVSAQFLSDNYFVELFIRDANLSFSEKIRDSRGVIKDVETEASPLRTNLWPTNWFPTARHEPVKKKKSVCR